MARRRLRQSPLRHRDFRVRSHTLRTGKPLDEANAPLILSKPSPPKSFWRSLPWWLMAMLGCSAASGVAIAAFVFLINLPPTADCKSVNTLSSHREQLYCAQVAAASGELSAVLAGLDLVGQWPENHPLHQEVEPLLTRWSETVLAEARTKLSQNNLAEAVQLVNRIPATSPLYETAQADLGTWKNQWQQGRAIYNQAQAALQQQAWDEADAQLQALQAIENPYWGDDQAAQLAHQITLEKQAQRSLIQAQELAADPSEKTLSEALETALQVDRSTYAWQKTQPMLNQWSDTLLAAGLQKWYAGHLNDGIALARQVSQNPDRAQQAREFIRLCQASQLAGTGLSQWTPGLQSITRLYRAIYLAHQISPSSPYHAQAKASRQTWEVHLQDLLQLQLAQTAADWQTRPAFQFAIAQAQKVPPDHPRRIQAQTLAAHWRLEIERIEDQPILDTARQLAQPATIPALQSAIAKAQAIPIHRALRQDAQSWIYVWNHQIETIEDQPILDRARNLANRGQLASAIEEAALIQPERALYGEAQGAIGTWRARIREIEIARAEEARRQQEAELARQAEAAAAEAAAAEATAAEADEFSEPAEVPADPYGEPSVDWGEPLPPEETTEDYEYVDGFEYMDPAAPDQ